ncbi:bestrophin family ion channel [Echinicola soli]|uniref:bestrophin family ion channel n=1 Tax=Echinicola soli TaxID=2591634 RepID=UPI003743DAB1
MIYTLSDRLIQVPFTPIALIGTAVSFIIGFRNNSAHGRIWETRQIWRTIVNSSRTFWNDGQNLINNYYSYFVMLRLFNEIP